MPLATMSARASVFATTSSTNNHMGVSSVGCSTSGTAAVTVTSVWATLSVDRRLATRVTVRVAGDLVPSVDVTDVRATYRGTWNPFASGTLVLDYTLANSGNTRVTGSEVVTATAPLGLATVAASSEALPEVLVAAIVAAILLPRRSRARGLATEPDGAQPAQPEGA